MVQGAVRLPKGDEMATERLSMRKTREVLRQKWTMGCSHRQIYRATGVSVATVSETASRAQLAGLDWATVEKLSDEELEQRLYPPAPGTGPQRRAGPGADAPGVKTPRGDAATPTTPTPSAIASCTMPIVLC